MDSKDDNKADSFKITLPNLRTAMNPVFNNNVRKSSTLSSKAADVTDRERCLRDLKDSKDVSDLTGSVKRNSSSVSGVECKTKPLVCNSQAGKNLEKILNAIAKGQATRTDFTTEPSLLDKGRRAQSGTNNYPLNEKRTSHYYWKKIKQPEKRAPYGSCVFGKPYVKDIVQIPSISSLEYIGDDSKRIEVKAIDSCERAAIRLQNRSSSKNSSNSSPNADQNLHPASRPNQSTPMKKITLFPSDLQNEISPIAGERELIKNTMLEEMKKINTKYIQRCNRPVNYNSSPSSLVSETSMNCYEHIASYSYNNSPDFHQDSLDIAKEAQLYDKCAISLYSPKVIHSPVKTNVMIGNSNTLFRPIKPVNQDSEGLRTQNISSSEKYNMVDDISNFMEWDCDETDL